MHKHHRHSSSTLAAAHAAVGAADTTGAEPDDELAYTHTVLESGGMASTEHGGVLADAQDPPGLQGMHTTELASALSMTAESAAADACKARVAVASKSGVWAVPAASRSL